MKKHMQKGGRGRDRCQKKAYTEGTIITKQEIREVGNEENKKNKREADIKRMQNGMGVGKFGSEWGMVGCYKSKSVLVGTQRKARILVNLLPP